MRQLRDPKVWVGLAITAVCLWLALRDVDFGQVGQAIAQANWFLLLAVSVPAYLLTMYVRALRWRYLTDPVHPIGTGPLFRSTAVGFMANNLIPLRIGEVVRAWYLARETGAGATALFGTVILERVIDTSVFLGLVGVIVGVYGFRLGAGGMAVGVPLLLVLSTPIVFVICLRLWPEPMIRLANTVVRPVSEPLAVRVEALVRSFADGLGAISRGGHVFWIVFYTAIIWLVLGIVPFWVGITALGLDLGSAGRTLAASYVLLTMVGLAVAVPSAPGFFGPYHLACKTALVPFGVQAGPAVAMGTLVHGVFWLTLTALGLAVLRTGRTRFGELGAHGRMDDLGDPAPAGGPAGKDPTPERR